MTVDRIGPIDSVQKFNKTEKRQEVAKAPSDSIDVSKKAREQSLVYHAIELAKSAPDIRMDKVAEIRSKLEQPAAYDDSVMESIAARLMQVFGL